MRFHSLCGLWDFAPVSDPTPPAFSASLPVPGNWRENPRFRTHNAPAWYGRTFTVTPAESEKRLFLHFRHIFRQAQVWLNGKMLVEREGHPAPFRVDLTGAVQIGDNRLEIRVDPAELPDSPPNGELFNCIPLPVAGIIDAVSLEICEPVRVVRLYAPADIEGCRIPLQITLQNDLPESAEASLCLTVSQNGQTLRILKQLMTVPCGESDHSAFLPLNEFCLWSPEHPALYDIRLELTAGSNTDIYTQRTGFKALEARGTEFYLNGKPYYLLGYGDDLVYPHGLPSATDKTAYFHGIRRAKEYGFNHVRHHSHFPFEAYLDAADELGLLVQPELALANTPRELLTEKDRMRYVCHWKRLILENRHHPCIAFWCGGNEMEWGYFFDREIYHIAKALDPWRPAASTDGNFMACDVNDSMDYASIVPAEYTDYLPWGELDDMFTRDHSGKPQIVHEMGNYTTLPAIHDLPRFEGAAAYPEKLAALARRIAENGQQDLYNKVYPHSLALQKLCHKLNIEKARLSPDFCGYHLWTLTDFYDATQGLLNEFYEDKAFTAGEFARINRQEVLLWDTRRAVFTAGEKTTLVFRLSRYGSDLPMQALLTLTLSDGQTMTAQVSVNGHGLMTLPPWELTMPAAEKELALRLTASLSWPGGQTENEWTLFVCPQTDIRLDKEIYIHYLSRHLFEGTDVPVRHFTIGQPIGEEQLIVTDCLYGDMIAAVEKGAAMLFFPRPDAFRHTITANSFKTPWWDIGPIWYLNHTNNRQICGILEEHPALDMLPYSGSWQLDLFGCVEQAISIDLDALELPADPILYGVDMDLHRCAYLFQFRLGKGKVLVCTMNHSRQDMTDPAVSYMLRSLINYAMSPSFTPRAEVTRRQLKDAMAIS